MLGLNETITAYNLAEALFDESGKFEVTTPSGEQFVVTCKPGHPILNLRPVPHNGKPPDSVHPEGGGTARLPRNRQVSCQRAKGVAAKLLGPLLRWAPEADRWGRATTVKETPLADTIKTGTILMKEGALMPESLRFESEPWTFFYMAGEIIRESRNLFRSSFPNSFTALTRSPNSPVSASKRKFSSFDSRTRSTTTVPSRSGATALPAPA